MRKSRFYAPLAAQPFEQWPLMNKAEWMRHFDAINTVGVSLAEAPGRGGTGGDELAISSRPCAARRWACPPELRVRAACSW